MMELSFCSPKECLKLIPDFSVTSSKVGREEGVAVCRAGLPPALDAAVARWGPESDLAPVGFCAVTLNPTTSRIAVASVIAICRARTFILNSPCTGGACARPRASTRLPLHLPNVLRRAAGEPPGRWARQRVAAPWASGSRERRRDLRGSPRSRVLLLGAP